MKFLIVFVGLLALGLAAEFKVKDGNETCIMVNVEGPFVYKMKVNGTEKTVSLDLDDAKVLSNESTCSSLKLLIEPKGVQVWFDFNHTSENQEITLVSKFMPSKVFDISDNDTLVFKAKSVFQSPKEKSYKCVSEVTTTLVGPKDVNITVMAVLKDFQAQSSNIEGEKFSNATECTQDRTTPTPTPTPTTTASTTPAPPDNSYSVSLGNVTCINMTGVIAFAITYETTKGTTNTTVIDIPVDHTVNGSCKYENSSTMQLLEIKFFKEKWMTSMVFTKDDSTYHISQINMTYYFDERLPDARHAGQAENIALDTKKDYLKADVKGYYLCNNNVTLALNDNVTLSTKNFKYQAFNVKSTADFDSKTVAECSQDDDSNSIVPIAVGAALAGLVVIVLIAYLIGRRRSKKSGYESV